MPFAAVLAPELWQDVFDNLSYVFRAVQNGLVQQYALSMLIAVLLLYGGWLILRL